MVGEWKYYMVRLSFFFSCRHQNRLFCPITPNFKYFVVAASACFDIHKSNEPTKMEDRSKSQHWGDHFLSPLRDMLGEACRLRQLPDCEFFLNKRDYPQLKVNTTRSKKAIPVEPYGFIFDKDDRDPEQDIDLVPEHTFPSYAPIVSFYAAAPDRFTDLPFPSSEDWEAACGLVFPHTFLHTKNNLTGEIEMNGNPRDLFTENNFRQFERSWDDGRVATAFFRGTATGGGTTVHNNQRLKVASLSYEWKDDPVKGGTEPYLDAAIVGWNRTYYLKTTKAEQNYTNHSDTISFYIC